MAGSGSTGDCAGSAAWNRASAALRASVKPTTAATVDRIAAAPQTQRGPTASVSRPASTIPSARNVTFELIRTVNALPRNRSGAPRCTSSALQTIVAPLPAPDTITQTAATQTVGGGEEEGGGVDPVGEVGAAGRHEGAADERADRPG